MSPTPSRVGSRVRLGVSLALMGAILAACGGNPASTTGSGAANLPPQTNPAVKDDAKNKDQNGPTRTLTGSVVDALTGEPVGKAVMFVEGIAVSAASTPIPPASPDARDSAPDVPGPDDAPPGGGGGPVQIAQAAPQASGAPTLASPGLTSPSPTASGSPGPDAAPSTSPAPGASATPGAAPSGAAKSPVPTGLGSPPPLKSVKVDSRGKFELKDLPEGTYSMTFWAPGYQAQTFQGSLKSTMDVQLVPLAVPKSAQHDLKGVVRQANNDAAGNVSVEATSYKAQVPGAHATSDDAGNFSLGGLVAGNYAVAAWTTNLEGEINAFALVKEVPVAVGREKRTVSPTLSLRAVTSPLLLAGTVEGTATEDEKADPKAPAKPPKADAVKATTIRAFLRAGDGEIPLATAAIGKDGYFRLRLPQPPEGVSYHLVASGATADGQTVYLHRYGITKSDPKLTLTLPDAPGAITVTDPTRGAAFSWEASDSAVTAYRVAIEAIGQDGDTLWEGWTTGTALQLPHSDELKLLKDGESYRYSLTAVTAADKAAELTELAAAEWATSRVSRPATFEVQKSKAGPRALKLSPAKPLTKPGAAAPAPTAKPKASASPALKSKRAKPMSDL